MNKNIATAIVALVCVPLMGACSAKSASKAFPIVPKPGPGPGPGPSPAAAGKNNGKDFPIIMAGIIHHPYAMGVDQVVIYDEDHGSACYGIGDRSIKIPVDANRLIGTHVMKDNLIDAAIFMDGTREQRIANGQIEVLTFEANGGTAKINVGTAGTGDFISADVIFERCY